MNDKNEQYSSMYEVLQQLNAEWRRASSEYDDAIDAISLLGNINPISAEEAGDALRRVSQRLFEGAEEEKKDSGFTTIYGKEFK